MKIAFLFASLLAVSCLVSANETNRNQEAPSGSGECLENCPPPEGIPEIGEPFVDPMQVITAKYFQSFNARITKEKYHDMLVEYLWDMVQSNETLQFPE